MTTLRLAPRGCVGRGLATLMLVAGMLLGGGALIGLGLLDGEGTAADQRILASVGAIRTDTVAGVARAVTVLADPVVYYLGVAVLIAGLWWRTRRGDLPALAAVTIIGAQMLGSAMKWLVARPRPDGSLVATVTSAFPSGHSLRAMAGAALLAWLLAWGGQRLWRRVAAAGVLVLAVGVGASRVLLQVHWSTDVLAGLVLGGLWFAAVLAILRPTTRSGISSRAPQLPHHDLR
ncbi:MAG TPA: phosphatase PAP2 family protein [Beutenbergiaceae bacterium]|nr:phosphatase PAP2 family protein [Beutenbergiaceae bacterium]